jgi:hypothetical protein
MGHLLAQQRVKIFFVVAVDQMAQFVSDDIFYARCMVNIYLKDKYFSENSVRIRKIFIFADCMTRNKGRRRG